MCKLLQSTEDCAAFIFDLCTEFWVSTVNSYCKCGTTCCQHHSCGSTVYQEAEKLAVQLGVPVTGTLDNLQKRVKEVCAGDPHASSAYS
jgi:hypothetical protein